ncbi:MAG TPA: chemotaxis response regulator protein-glutamate methylesterase [Stellaceae bacterium]|nr:chemotaxis response regulator protein-glutamate methylesterase [Stellaceae bacterium]
MPTRATAEAPPGTSNPVRVMIVDDSAVIRGVETRILEAEPDVKVVASVSNAQLALNQLARTQVDVMILDIEMPVLDGLSALPQIRRISPQTKVIMASTLTTRGGEISLEALRLGAIDFVPKPTVGSIFSAEDFKRELVNKVTALGRVRLPGAPATPQAHGSTPRAPLPTLPAISGPAPKLRPAPGTIPTIIGIGSSTGGPQALQTTLTALPAAMQLPIVIVQHMPPTFTRLLADQIARATGRPTCEGQDGMAIAPGRIYVAPGGMHMCIERHEGRGIIRLNNNPPENFCRPAVDPLFRSLAAYGPSALVLVLTGMGSDGARGAEAVAQAGGTVLAQDEATSVVWGMPGAAAATGVVSALIPLGEIGHRLGDYAAGKAR